MSLKDQIARGRSSDSMLVTVVADSVKFVIEITVVGLTNVAYFLVLFLIIGVIIWFLGLPRSVILSPTPIAAYTAAVAVTSLAALPVRWCMIDPE